MSAGNKEVRVASKLGHVVLAAFRAFHVVGGSPLGQHADPVDSEGIESGLYGGLKTERNNLMHLGRTPGSE